MAFTNNVMIVRHGLLAKLVKLWKENRLLEEIDRLPIELSPRKSKVIGRCCVHKERAVWKYKTLPLLGFDMQDEVDELTPLSEYAKQALLRSENKKENLMCVVDEACSSCVQVNYEITNLCRGCVARSCYMNCPKDAIRFKKNGQAEIDHLYQLRQMPPELPLSCYRVYPDPLRGSLPGEGDQQGRVRGGTYRRIQMYLLRQMRERLSFWGDIRDIPGV